MSESDESKLIPVFIQWRKDSGTQFHQLKPHSAPMDRGRVVNLPGHKRPIYFYRMAFRSFEGMRLAGYYLRAGVIEVKDLPTRANSLIAETAQPSLL